MATKSGSPGRPSESRWLTALAGDKHRLQRSKAMRNGLNHTSLNQVAAVHQIAACDSAWPHSAVAGRDTDSGAERDRRELWVSNPETSSQVPVIPCRRRSAAPYARYQRNARRFSRLCTRIEMVQIRKCFSPTKAGACMWLVLVPSGVLKGHALPPLRSWTSDRSGSREWH